MEAEAVLESWEVADEAVLGAGDTDVSFVPQPPEEVLSASEVAATHRPQGVHHSRLCDNCGGNGCAECQHTGRLGEFRPMSDKELRALREANV